MTGEEDRELREREAEAEERRARSQAAGLGYTLVASLVIGLGIGWAIDAARGTEPFWTVTLALVFLVVGFYLVIKETLK